jgi:hypothetical protein
MEPWEYRAERFAGDMSPEQIVDGCNDLGSAGWELFLVDHGAHLFWFKRAYVPVAPTVVTAPHVEATTLSVGDVATCTKGVWNERPNDYAYQWSRDDAPIDGAAAASYTFVAADVDAMISCAVTASNSAGSAESTSNAIGPITDGGKQGR